MKKYLILNLPWLYYAVRAIYRLTPVYLIKNRQREHAHAAKTEHIKKRTRELMKGVFNDDYRVVNGPFKGMKYIDSATGSSLLPKILGSYEEPIHEWVETVIAKRYDKILDIGCAEGYYAVGFAMRLPGTKVVAYDTNRDALKLCRELMVINDVDNVELREGCDFQELDDQITDHTLVFCDIEGAERELLDLANAKKLRSADMIIESHDSYMPGTTEMLIERFGDTHRISVAVDYSKRLKPYATPNDAGVEVLAEIIDEHRAKLMKFLYCESFAGAQKAEEQKR